MGSLEIQIYKGRQVDSISIQNAIKILDSIYNLYYHLARNDKALKSYPKEEFKLGLSNIHFSRATFNFKTTHEFKQYAQYPERYSRPVKALSQLLSLKNTPEAKKKIDGMITNKARQKKILKKTLDLIPQKKGEKIKIKYNSPYIEQPIKCPDITYELRKPFLALKRICESKSFTEKTIIGILKGIVTTTENHYLLVEVDSITVKCYYTEKSFKSDLKVSNLRVTEDILLLTGTYLAKEGKKALDQLINITEIYQIITDIDYDNEQIIETTMNHPEKMFDKEEDEDPDLYTDEDLKVN